MASLVEVHDSQCCTAKHQGSGMKQTRLYPICVLPIKFSRRPKSHRSSASNSRASRGGRDGNLARLLRGTHFLSYAACGLNRMHVR